jgi:murein DD-endopeptidase MepM/ murein hydrolase activator NlpD
LSQLSHKKIECFGGIHDGNFILKWKISIRYVRIYKESIPLQRMVAVRKAFTKNKKNHATFMYVPESEGKVVSLRIPLWLPKVMAVFLVLLLIATIASFYFLDNIHQEYANSKKVIVKLSDLNQVQKQEIEKLQGDAVQIRQQLEENLKALDQIREIVGIKKSKEAESEAAAPQPMTVESSDDTSSSSTAEMAQIKTSYKELSRALLSQRQLIQSSMDSVKKKMAYLNARPSMKPVDSRITDFYGYRKNPFTNRGSEFHPGIDFAGNTGDPVQVTGDGVVTFAGWYSGYGKVVMVSHSDGIVTLYGHNSKLLIAKGDKVKKGQVICHMGSTGRSTGAHLHYEVRINGKAANPANYLNEK